MNIQIFLSQARSIKLLNVQCGPSRRSPFCHIFPRCPTPTPAFGVFKTSGYKSKWLSPLPKEDANRTTPRRSGTSQFNLSLEVWCVRHIGHARLWPQTRCPIRRSDKRDGRACRIRPARITVFGGAAAPKTQTVWMKLKEMTVCRENMPLVSGIDSLFFGSVSIHNFIKT